MANETVALHPAERFNAVQRDIAAASEQLTALIDCMHDSAVAADEGSAKIDAKRQASLLEVAGTLAKQLSDAAFGAIAVAEDAPALSRR